MNAISVMSWLMLSLMWGTMNMSAAAQQPNQQVALKIDKVEVEIKPSPNSGSQGKDSWDKFASVSTFLSGIVVALIGIYATSVYNARQLGNQAIQKDRELSIQRVQTIEKLFPYLTSTDEKQRLGALDAIAALGDEELATKLATRFGGESGASALASLSRSDNPQVAKNASRALADLFAALRPSVFEFQSGEEAWSTGFFVSADGQAIVPDFALVEEPYHARLDRSGPAYPVTVIRRVPGTHLALVKVEAPLPVAPLALTGAQVESGDQVVVVGYAPNKPWVSLVGRVVGTSDDKIFTDLQLEPGMAGAPVMNARSELVGIALGSDVNRKSSFLAPASLALSLVSGRE